MRVRTIQTNFTAGELSPRTEARVDLARAANGVHRLRNRLPSVVGPALPRPPSLYMGPVPAPGAARLVPFVFGEHDADLLIVGAEKIWAMRQGVLRSDLASGALVAVGHPWTAADRERLDWAQDGDFLFFATPGTAPQKLTRTGPGAFTLAPASLDGLDFAALGFPICVGFHQERLVWAGFHKKPQTFRASKVGDWDSYTVPNAESVVDDDPMDILLVDGAWNQILHLRSRGGALILFCAGQEWIVEPASGQPFASAYIARKAQTTHGTRSTVRPAMAHTAAIFVDKSGTSVLAFDYSLMSDKFLSDNHALLADHLTGAGIVRQVWSRAPMPILWAITQDGLLISMTWDPLQKVVGWARHDIPGYAPVDLCVLPESDGSGDGLWVCVRRLSDGSHHIVFLPPVSRSSGSGLDLATYYRGPAVSSLSGLDYLEGQSVTIIADAAEHPRRTVIAGKIALAAPATEIWVGLPMVSEIELRPSDAGSSGQTSTQYARRRLVSATIRARGARGFDVGVNPGDGRAIRFQTVAARMTADALDLPLPVDVADVRDTQVSLRGWSRGGRLVLRQTGPRQSEVLGVIREELVNV